MRDESEQDIVDSDPNWVIQTPISLEGLLTDKEVTDEVLTLGGHQLEVILDEILGDRLLPGDAKTLLLTIEVEVQ